MAETEKSLATRAQAHLRAAGKPVPALPDIVPLIPTALATVGRRVRSGPGWRGLQKAFSPTITAGYCDLSGQTGILFDITRAEIRFTPAGGSNVVAEKFFDHHQLDQSNLDTAKGYCAPFENGLRFRKPGGQTSFNGTTTITTSFVPAIPDLETAGLIEVGVLALVELAAQIPVPAVSVGVTEQ